MELQNVLVEIWFDKLIIDTACGKLVWARKSQRSEGVVAVLPNFYTIEILSKACACEYSLKKYTPKPETMISDTLRGGLLYSKAVELYKLARQSADQELSYEKLAIYNAVNKVIMGGD